MNQEIEEQEEQDWKPGDIVYCWWCASEMKASNLDLAGVDAGSGQLMWSCGKCSVNFANIEINTEKEN